MNSTTDDSGGTVESPANEAIRERMEEVGRSAKELLEKTRDLVLRHPAWSIAGAAAAGFLFARLVARRHRS